jgi:hypothetical protein
MLRRMFSQPAALRRRLASDECGIAVTEFGFIAPLFLLMLMGIFDYGFAMYAQAALSGAVQEGARRASLENTLWTDIEARVNAQVRQVIPTTDPNTQISFSLDPSFYQNFDDITRPEVFEDRGRGSPAVFNGSYDADECFVDRNGNRTWNADVGLSGRGGAQDVVSIRATVTYVRIFPFWRLIGQPQSVTLSANTFLRNQPFAGQAVRVGERICP